MNKLEATQVVETIGSIYTNYKPMNLGLAVDAWEGVFADIPLNVVMGALYSYARQSKEFPPTPGQLYEIIHQAIHDGDEADYAEAWNMVILAIRNGAYGADEEFAKLPEDVQEAIGGSHYLHELALSEDVNWGVESSNFYRNLRTVRERKKNTSNLPNSVKAQIAQLKKDLGNNQIENKQAVAMLEQKQRYEEMSRLTIEKMEQEEPQEMSEGAKGFADMLRERLGVK